MSEARPMLTVVSNADANFFPGLAVAVASAVAAASGRFDYRFLILDGNLDRGKFSALSERVRAIAEQRGIRVELELLSIDQNRLAALPERRGSRMTYAKLVLPEVLGDLDSIVYLDADVLCFKGVEEIEAPAGSGEWLLAGARDYFSVIEKDCPWIDEVPAAERKLPYINCGVMWMNLRGLREMDFTSRSIAARAAIGAARQGDQSVFNFLCRGKSFILPPVVNHRTSIGATRPLCEGDLDLNIHYIGAPKPWLGPPKTSTWLAHHLWHQAQVAIFPDAEAYPPVALPWDVKSIRRKAMLQAIFNPARAANYRSDLKSLKDPGMILRKASEFWISRT